MRKINQAKNVWRQFSLEMKAQNSKGQISAGYLTFQIIEDYTTNIFIFASKIPNISFQLQLDR